ncbi:MAG: SDH family Clp fold serine proteinase [Peptococcaceae bacterium]
MEISSLFWLFFIVSMLMPILKQRSLEAGRIRLIREMEKKRGSRVITLIHREESMSFLGLAVRKYINIEDSEAILRAIRFTPDDMPIDIILHTPGGLVLASEQIAYALKKHKASVTVFVPHYAMSGGTMISLAADKIIMDENAVLGPVDPQLGQYPAVSLLSVLKDKDINEIDDETLIYADMARKALKQIEATLCFILAEHFSQERACELARIFSEGRWTHDYPIRFEELKELDLFVSTDMPYEVYKLMDLYPQTQNRRPSVHYIPIPYGKDDSK